MAVALESVTTAPSDAVSRERQPSQTAQEYIAEQLSLEADAREALPYQFDKCTKALGPLRQSVFACLTCSPPPASPHQTYTPAGVCYSCSISCHGEHTLVELFAKRDFACDCGTIRFANSGTPCTLRPASAGNDSGIGSEPAHPGNKYNHNFQGKFCACGDEYDPMVEKGTMYQCVGLGTIETGGCGEDWYHPECLMGLPRTKPTQKTEVPSNGTLETVKEEGEEHAEERKEGVSDEDTPPGFPHEDDFDQMICYKCVDAFPWIKQYAGTTGFLPAVRADGSSQSAKDVTNIAESATDGLLSDSGTANTADTSDHKKRKAEDEAEESQDSKKARTEGDPEVPATSAPAVATTTPRHASLPTPPTGPINLFVKEDFRDYLCRCVECFPRLAKHPQLLEIEETYEPPLSESDAPPAAVGSNRSAHSGSIYDRGEAALSSVDRVRAIEGVMAYNHMRDKVKAFLQPFAESGKAVSAEDIKAYFAQLRGDEQAMRDAAQGAQVDKGQDDHRKEQGGY